MGAVPGSGRHSADPGEPRLDELEAVEEPQHVGAAAGRAAETTPGGRRSSASLRSFASSSVRDAVADGQVAARRPAGRGTPRGSGRFRLVGDEVQRARAQHRHRLARSIRPMTSGWPRIGRLAQVTQDHRDLVAGGEQRLAVGRDHRIVVDVDHPYFRARPPGPSGARWPGSAGRSRGRETAGFRPRSPGTGPPGRGTTGCRALSPATSGNASSSRLAASRSAAKLSFPPSR